VVVVVGGAVVDVVVGGRTVVVVTWAFVVGGIVTPGCGDLGARVVVVGSGGFVGGGVVVLGTMVVLGTVDVVGTTVEKVRWWLANPPPLAWTGQIDTRLASRSAQSTVVSVRVKVKYRTTTIVPLNVASPAIGSCVTGPQSSSELTHWERSTNVPTVAPGEKPVPLTATTEFGGRSSLGVTLRKPVSPPSGVFPAAGPHPASVRPTRVSATTIAADHCLLFIAAPRGT
jgi:hypothetical protein